MRELRIKRRREIALMMNYPFTVSVCVTTYKPDDKKLRLTLESIMRQKNCPFEIIVADDGTEDLAQEEIEDYFAAWNFHAYKIVRAPKNYGTVHNTLAAYLVARGKYIKDISPGDYLYADTALADMTAFMEAGGHEAAFGRACYYCEEQGVYRILDYMNPRDLSPYEAGDFAAAAHAQLLCQDYPCGAAFMARRELLTGYMRLLLDRVTFTEDRAYTMMLADGIRLAFWNHNFVWYEYGGGISTNRENVWQERIIRDNQAFFALLAQRHPELSSVCRWHIFDGYEAEEIWYAYAEETKEYYRRIDEARAQGMFSYLRGAAPEELAKLVREKVTFSCV